MRILFVIPYFYPTQAFGGPVSVAFNMGKELAKRGHEVVVFTSDAKDLENRLNVESNEIEGMTVYYLRNLSMGLVKNSKLFITSELTSRIASEVKSLDIIHAHEYRTYQNIVVHKLAKKYGVPYILQAHGSLTRIGREVRKWLYDFLFGRRVLKGASKVIALSRVEADQYRGMGVPEEKIEVIPNGIDLSEYAKLPLKGSFKKRLNIPEDKKLILYLGRIHKTKGINVLIEAYAYLTKNMKYDNAVLVIVGPDDGYLAEAKSLFESLSVSGSVLFTGFISSEDKLKALVDANVFVTPSFCGFPVTFLEACAIGTPIITTTLGDTLEWIDDNVGYATLPTHSDLAKAIHAIISDDELHENFSRNCIDTVKSKFSLEKVVNKLEQIYKEIA